MTISTSITACRSCASPRLAPILDLGETPLANALLKPEQLRDPEPRVPLRLVLCQDCSLLQITETVPPEVLFREYVYRSSFSDEFIAHARAIAERMVGQLRLGPASLAVEVASNDGYLLRWYKARGVPVLGIEPASNIARIAESEHGIPTVNEFFGAAVAARLAAEGRRADVVHANNVLAHVADLNGFVAGLARMLKDDGVVVSESPYALDFIAKTEFDTIYHEHLCYYSLTALDALFARHGMRIVDVERLAVHGGSLRIFARRAGAEPTAAVRKLLAEEAAWGIARPQSYRDFAAGVGRIRSDLLAKLAELKAAKRTVAAYGAAAKGATLLNYCAIGRDQIEYVVDRSPLKQGRYVPGARLPIVPCEHIAARRPDYLLILAWNFADEIMQQQDAFRRAGGRFIIPIPSLRVL